jgi:SNF family Na+-dependent transporter
MLCPNLFKQTGIGGNLASCIFLPTLLEAGASSSIMGLLSVFLVDLAANWKFYESPRRELSKWVITLLLTFAIGLLPWIDNFAHLGGFIGGFICSSIVLPNNCSLRNSLKVRVLGVVMLLLVYGLGFALFYARVNIPQQCGWCKYLSCIPITNWCDIE